ncbi:MAG: cation diffusion facilitator family transporter [Elusimicrobia bacterium]|nr:cation diffusion facilitator family transporter [Elusimicrobiota bacterium]
MAAEDSNLRLRLYASLALNGLIVAAEFVAGALTNSVGLITDASHNLIDQGALSLTLYAHILAGRPADPRRTFGYHRVGILVALFNSLLLILASVALSVFAIQRLLHPEPVAGLWVMGASLFAFAANFGVAMLLKRAAEDDLNIRGAFWHMLADAWVSFGVAAAGLMIRLTGWNILDPLLSLVIVLVILKGAAGILIESAEVLMEGAPTDLEADRVAAVAQSVAGVKDVHDVHSWALTPRLSMLTCHVTVDEKSFTPQILKAVREKLEKECGAHHLTVQVETTCCHPEGPHCDLPRLHRRKSD